MYDPIRDSAAGSADKDGDTQSPTEPEATTADPPASSSKAPETPENSKKMDKQTPEENHDSSHKDAKTSPSSSSTRPPKRPAPDSEPSQPKRNALPSFKKARTGTDTSRISGPFLRMRRRTPSPGPSRSRSRSRSPPRQRKRPGASSRIDAAARTAQLQRQTEREATQLAASQRAAVERGSHDVVKQHYNTVPQRGREWRRTDSKIKGLRSFNNWIKSVLIQKFSPNEDYTPGAQGAVVPGRGRGQGIMVLDIGCGKGGDLGKWMKAPQRVEVYVGVDPAEVSVEQARERYEESAKRARGRIFEGHFFAKDGFGEWLGEVPIVRSVGIDKEVGPGTSSRWGQAGFDVVTMMFCMHYAFESEEKARGMLRNVAGALKKGGRFIGVIPNSDIIREKVEAFHQKKKAEGEAQANGDVDHAEEDGEVKDDTLMWGNELYTVRFPGETPEDGIFRPPFGWKYSYFITEAVEAPEYIVPFEAFRAIAEDYNLEMQYRRPFHEVWKEEKNDPDLGELSMRMGVTKDKGGDTVLSPEEWEAVGFYHAFCFYKV